MDQSKKRGAIFKGISLSMNLTNESPLGDSAPLLSKAMFLRGH